MLLLLIAFCAAAEIKLADNLFMQEIGHASFILTWLRNDGSNYTIYNDPIFPSRFADSNPPDLIMITHPHFDHLSASTIIPILKLTSKLVAPPLTIEQRVLMWWPLNPDNLVPLANFETTVVDGAVIEAIPMYNDPAFIHPEGAWNGYVLDLEGTRVYIAGDTDAVPAMYALQNITVAFIPMTPPFTCEWEFCADAVLAFRPLTVYPYHYEAGAPEAFKAFVDAQSGGAINVVLLDWYDNEDKRAHQDEKMMSADEFAVDY